MNNKGKSRTIHTCTYANRRVLNQILQKKNFVVRGWVMWFSTFDQGWVSQFWAKRKGWVTCCFATTDFPNTPTHPPPPPILINQSLSSSNRCQLSLVRFLRSETRRRSEPIWPDTNWIFRWRLRQSSKSVYTLCAVFARCKPASQQWRIYHVSSSTLNILWADNQKLFVKNRSLLVILLPDRDFLACSDS